MTGIKDLFQLVLLRMTRIRKQVYTYKLNQETWSFLHLYVCMLCFAIIKFRFENNYLIYGKKRSNYNIYKYTEMSRQKAKNLFKTALV